MSAPALLHLPAQVVQWLLVAYGQGSDPTDVSAGSLGPWPVYADREPDGDGVPDETLTVYDVDAQDDGTSMTDGEPFQHFGVQVRVRARSADTGRAKAEAVRKFLAQLPRYAGGTADVTVPARAEGQPQASYRVYNFSKVLPVRRMGQETGKTRRHQFTLDARAPVRRTSPPQATALYRFDGNLLDSSGFGRHLSPGGGESYGPGVFGQGLLAGSPFRTQDLLTGSPTTGTYSVSFWAVRHSNASLILTFNDGNGDTQFGVGVSQSNISAAWVNNFQAVSYPRAIPQGEPYFVAMTVDGGRFLLYYDGQFSTNYTLTPTADRFDDGGPGVFSAFTTAPGAFTLDDLVVIDGRALTAAEIIQLEGLNAPYPT